MRIEPSFLTTRVARRIFVLFMVCAVLPVVALALVSFGFVSSQIERQSKSQLRQAAKSAAITTFERLTERETELALLVETLSIADPHEDVVANWTAKLETRYRGLYLLLPDGRSSTLLASSSPPPQSLRERTTSEGTRLSVTEDQRIFLDVPGASGIRVLAEIDNARLFQPEQGNGFVGADHFLVFDGENELLFSSYPRREEFIEAARLKAFDAHSGTFSWEADEIDNVAASWMLFLRGRYRALPWRFIVSNPRIEIFSTASDFKLTLSLVVVLCLSIAFLVSATQIRRTMAPLEILRKGTERISSGDYATRIELPQDDEFALLSRSFNEMSTRVSEQFEEIRAARDAAESASRAKSDFLAMMSHEIRTPMNGILGMAELAMDTSDLGEQRDCLRIVKSSTETLLYVLKDVLDFAAIERGEIPIRDEPFPVAEGLSGAVELFRASAAQKGIELATKIKCPVDLVLRGDINRLRQVVSNLVGNALKFTTEGRVEVTISSEKLSEESSLLHVEVEDTGIGVPEHKLRLVFQAFTQAESYMNRRYGGTGLGLATSKSLIDMMGGRIWAESTVGVGSSFHFELALSNDAASVDETLPGKTSERSGEERARGARILVAEDNVVNQKVIERMLQREGHVVRIVPNGQEAVDVSARESFDLILMDLQMPLLNGLEAAEIIRRRATSSNPPPPIIALTAHASDEDAVHCLESGMVDVLTKPLRRDALARVLDKHLALVS